MLDVITDIFNVVINAVQSLVNFPFTVSSQLSSAIQ